MKKILIVAITITVVYTAAAQKIATPPAAVRAAFEKQYPGVAAQWEKEKDNYEAGFKKDGNTMSTLYEANGTLVETETDIKVSDLPLPVVTYVKEKCKGKKIQEAAKIVKANGTVNYEAEVAGTDLIFDADGNFVKKIKE